MFKFMRRLARSMSRRPSIIRPPGMQVPPSTSILDSGQAIMAATDIGTAADGDMAAGDMAAGDMAEDISAMGVNLLPIEFNRIFS